MSNAVLFVSLGPGEAELITLKALRALQAVDYIFCPYTLTKEGKQASRAIEILTELGIEANKIRPFNVPMSMNRSEAMLAYSKASEEIEELYRQEKKVAVTAEGDAGFYSSIHYIQDALMQKNIFTKRIAGVPAFIACGALANLHIVKQEEELSVVPGTITSQTLLQQIGEGKTVVIMKVSKCIEAIKEAIATKPAAHFHYFENVGSKDKEFYTHDTSLILSRTIPYFSLMIIHQ